MAIEFSQAIEDAEFYSPMADFDLESQPVEYRRDPLTGQRTRVVAQWFPEADEADAEPDVGDGEDCFFCPEMVDEATPEYPDYVGTDRGSRGEATSFPNLFPYGTHSNVVVLTEDHFRPVGGLPADILADGLSCALAYVHAAIDHDGSQFASINMNYLPPAGSSVVHPHLQAIVDDHGTNGMRRRLDAERDYHADTGDTYWAALLDEEREGPRYVGRTGGVEWLAPFAPTAQYHVTGVTDVTGIPDPEDSVLADIAAGIENVLAFYDDRGLDAFNFALQLVRDEPASPAVVDLVARPAFEKEYVNDVFCLQALHDERIVDVPPEEYASEGAAFF